MNRQREANSLSLTLTLIHTPITGSCASLEQVHLPQNDPGRSSLTRLAECPGRPPLQAIHKGPQLANQRYHTQYIQKVWSPNDGDVTTNENKCHTLFSRGGHSPGSLSDAFLIPWIRG